MAWAHSLLLLVASLGDVCHVKRHNILPLVSFTFSQARQFSQLFCSTLKPRMLQEVPSQACVGSKEYMWDRGDESSWYGMHEATEQDVVTYTYNFSPPEGRGLSVSQLHIEAGLECMRTCIKKKTKQPSRAGVAGCKALGSFQAPGLC